LTFENLVKLSHYSRVSEQDWIQNWLRKESLTLLLPILAGGRGAKTGSIYIMAHLCRTCSLIHLTLLMKALLTS